MTKQKLLSKRVIRFAIIGLCNAAITFSILNICFYWLHQPKIISSVIATSCALVFSFIMNRDFVFVDKTKKARRQLPAFVIVTLSGSFLVLNSVYAVSLQLLNGHEHLIISLVRSLTSISLSRSFVDINLSTITGALVAMLWNYNGYKWAVFKANNEHALGETLENTP